MDGLKEFLQLLSSLGGTGVMAVGIWLWIRGELRSKREVEAKDAELKKAEARADMWQTAALRSLENNQRLQGTTQRALDLATNVTKATEPGGNTGQPGQGS